MIVLLNRWVLDAFSTALHPSNEGEEAKAKSWHFFRKNPWA